MAVDTNPCNAPPGASDRSALSVSQLSEQLKGLVEQSFPDVWVAGEHLVALGELTRMDVAEISAAAARWGRLLMDGEVKR